MPFAYFQKLSARNKRIYLRSDEIHRVDIPGRHHLMESVRNLETALTTGRRSPTQKAAQDLMDRLTSQLGVSPVRVRVLERRPSRAASELHGLYEADHENGLLRVSVWMRTARRDQVVKFKTFLRTLLHELCHHLDFEHFGLTDSFHTEGFFKRESSLVRQLLPEKTE
jgi:hypothetical protein